MIKNRSNIKLRYQILDLVLRLGNISTGSRSIHLRAGFNYLRNLIAEGRFAEVDALLVRGLSKTLARAPLKRRQKRDIFIDARTERLNPDGTVIPLETVKLEPRSEPLASIIIPCFNYGRYLYDAVNSALSQTVQSLEIIIVNDGSTDAETVQVLNEIAKIDRVTVVHQDNAGLPAARNKGISQARGEFITCLDADDTLDPTYVESTIAVLLVDLSVGFAYSYVRCFGDVDEIWLTHDFDPEEALYANFTSVSATFRRADWEAIGGYASIMRGGFEDWEFWIRLSTLGRRGRAIKWPLFNHRRHGRTMTHDAKDMKEELQSRIRSLNPLFFTDASLRKRLLRLTTKPQRVPKGLQLLSRGCQTGDPRPALLVIIPWLKAGGAERLLVTILRGLIPDFHITIATTDIDPHPLRPDFLTVSNEIFHLAEMFEDPHEQTLFIQHLADSRRVQFALTSSSLPAISALTTLKRNIPNLFSANILHNNVADSVFRAAVGNDNAVDKHIIVSSKIRASLVSLGISNDKIIYIPNGIKPPAIKMDRKTARASLGIFDNTPILVWIGRLAPEKRPTAFVDIIRNILKLYDIVGVIVGDGPERNQVETLIHRYNLESHIKVLGYQQREKLGAIYAAADLLVLTSEVEGMPLVILEGLASGVPVASTQVGDIADVLSDKPYGLLVEANRVEHLGEVIAAKLPSISAIDKFQIIEDFQYSPYDEKKMIDAYRELFGLSSAH
jgi:glycosyltransferase involved in cell wall biosynthesis